MCFGGKSEREDDAPAPRRASAENGKSVGKGNGEQSVSRPRSREIGESSRREEYAPPSGPPPGQGNYAPPSGPPPGRNGSNGYAPPDGPPPGHQGRDEYAPPPGPPTGQNDYAPPPGPPPGNDNYAPPTGPPPGHIGDQYAPPAGPPPGHQPQSDYAPPSGPPPSSHQPQNDYAPPPGPPPPQGGQNEYAPPPGPPPPQGSQGDYAPPPGPPPASNDDWMKPPPGPPGKDSSKEHNWETAVPDTSLFPPPPAIFSGFEVSPAHNSTEEEADAGEAWCAQYPFVGPQYLDHTALRALETSNIRLMEPPGFDGKLEWRGLGHWQLTTSRNSPDRSFIAYPPLYSAHQHQPLRTGTPKMIYYEVKLREDCRKNTLAIGFTTLPYPSFRLPGWHRGSLAVHGDDGHKYINDLWGGKSFTEEFKIGDTYGIGMTLSPPVAGAGAPAVEVFFTKNGSRAGGWDLHEEVDAEQDGPVEGLEGMDDLSAVVGTFEGVNIEVVFDPAKWRFKGLQ